MMSIDCDVLAKSLIDRNGLTEAYRLAVEHLCNAAESGHDLLWRRWNNVCQVIEDRTYDHLNEQSIINVSTPTK